MTTPPYTLSDILPFVRQSLSEDGIIEYRPFVNALWTELEKAEVPGILRTPQQQLYSGQVFQYDQAPPELRALTTEAFFHLFHSGYIAPVPPESYINPPQLFKFQLTRTGLEWLKGGEPLPEDVVGYMNFLNERVENLDPVIEQYVIEALHSFARSAYFAAAVMLGAAAEMAIYLLAESMLNAIADAKKRNKLKSVLERRKLVELFELVKDTIQNAYKANSLPHDRFEGSATYLLSLFEAIRLQRNDAVHPMYATVSADSVRHLMQSFPYSLGKSEELREWFGANPRSI